MKNINFRQVSLKFPEEGINFRQVSRKFPEEGINFNEGGMNSHESL